MKNLQLHALVLVGALGLALTAAAQPAEDRSTNGQPPSAQDEMTVPVPPAAESETPPGEAGRNERPSGDNAAPPPESFVKEGGTTPRFVAPMPGGTNAAPAATSPLDPNALSTNATPPALVVKDGEKGLRMNFRGAPLDLVLSYLSDAAGFIIVPEADVRGKVDVWSNQPLTKDEAVELLSRVLAKEGYAVLRDGRTLTIVTQAEAKKRDIPVKTGYEPTGIPKDQQVVTQIIPVRFINAVQLAKDLQPLMAAQTTMAANEGGNALVITDTQQNIHRMAEIIKALDTTVSSLSAVRVFSLRYADAKTVSDMVKEVFAGGDSSRTGAGGAGGRGQFRFGGGPFGAMFGGGDAGGNASSSSGRPGASKVVATADERSNSLVVSAPDDLMPTIEELVRSVDVNVEDVTEIRVFRLHNADPQETADMLTSLFPDSSSSSQQNMQRGPFGGFFRGQMGNAGTDTSSTASDRMKKQSKVIAVADMRTRSVVVTAARDTMDQIAKMLSQLDSDPAHNQKVFVFETQNTDPTIVQQRLQDLFSGQNTTSSRSTTASGQAGTQLSTRAQQQNQQQNSSTRNSGYGGAGASSMSGRTIGN
jgi:type II secretory pathway component GspD/PulD (secretin)